MRITATIEKARELYGVAAGEADYRVVANRAYYGLFQYLLKHPKCADFVRSKAGDDHQKLIEYLKQSPDSCLQKIGYRKLPGVRSIRNQADYDLDKPFPAALAEEALLDAEEVIFDWIPID